MKFGVGKMVKFYVCLAEDCRKTFLKPNEEGNCPYCGCNRIKELDGRVEGKIIYIEDLGGGARYYTLQIPDTYLEEAVEKWKSKLL